MFEKSSVIVVAVSSAKASPLVTEAVNLIVAIPVAPTAPGGS